LPQFSEQSATNAVPLDVRENVSVPNEVDVAHRL
jgi:hypothetical protein